MFVGMSPKEEKMQGIREKRRRMRRIRNGIILAVVLTSLLLIGYFAMTFFFQNHFFFRTEINGLQVGGLSVSDAEAEIARDEGKYILIISDRDKNLYTIEGAQIGSNYAPDGSVGKALKEQNPYGWLTAVFSGNHIDVKTPMEYDAGMLYDTVSKLDCFREENIEPPENAKIVLEDGKYQVVQEKQGNQLILDRVVAAVQRAVSEGDGELHLTDEMYESPEITEESSEITEAMAAIDSYSAAKVVYKIADYDEKLEGEELFDMIQVAEDFSVTIDKTKLERFVQRLASKYNTYADVRKFKTSKGDIVEIGGGDYGWVIDKEEEAKLLEENILAGGTTEREPVYSQTAKVEGLDDIGNTYVEIDYTNQHLWYYENGSLKLESDLVSGNIAKGNGSPDGVFKVVYKQSPAVLVGEDYESDVTYFIVFAYNVGIHDASWRSNFGGDYYKTRGSHGCINVPLATAASLYEMIAKDTPVIAYYREPIELSTENCKISNAFSYVDPDKEKNGEVGN